MSVFADPPGSYARTAEAPDAVESGLGFKPREAAKPSQAGRSRSPNPILPAMLWAATGLVLFSTQVLTVAEPSLDAGASSNAELNVVTETDQSSGARVELLPKLRVSAGELVELPNLPILSSEELKEFSREVLKELPDRLANLGSAQAGQGLRAPTNDRGESLEEWARRLSAESLGLA